MFYKRKAISRELYNYCLKEGYGDAALIAKWKKVIIIIIIIILYDYIYMKNINIYDLYE